jgi:uncharacterized protein YfaS (alpha-2-macroglobulin family)
MNSKKQMLAASILAIGLAVGLGTISFGLFSGGPSSPKLESVLEVYTQKGGLGFNVSGGDFEPFDNVSIYAYLTQGGIKLQNRPVTFTIEKPDDFEIIRTVSTNNSGIAETDTYLLPSESHVAGTWHVVGNATVDNEAIDDALDFQCKSQNARIEIFSKRNGVPSTSFLPSDLVLLEAQLSYRNASIAGTPVTFEVSIPNGTEFLLQTVSTNDLGTANITFQIPWPSESSQGIWQVSAASEVYEQTVKATTTLECELLPLSIDVFTQKGGIGPNTPGGYFTLNETVILYAEVRDVLNQTMSSQLITFAIIQPNGTALAYFTQVTNSSGIANITIRIPPDAQYVGTYEVYARSVYNDVVLLDTLTFIAKQS